MPILDEGSTVTDDFATDTSHAFNLVPAAVLDGSANQLGTWHQL